MVATNGVNGNGSTALARKDTAGLATPPTTGTAMGIDPTNMPQLWWLMERLAGTGFLPEAVKTPGQALAIVLAGRELGLGTMASLRGINLIKGRVSISASTQLSLMLRAGIRIKWIETSATRAILELSRDGSSPYRSTFTIEEARAAGLITTNRDGSPGNWTKYPAAMLRARAITAGARAYAADLLDGCYDPEEIEEQPAQVRGARVDAGAPPDVSEPAHDPQTGEVALSADEVSALFGGATTLDELNKAATAQEKSIATMDEETQGRLREVYATNRQRLAPKKSRTESVKEKLAPAPPAEPPPPEEDERGAAFARLRGAKTAIDLNHIGSSLPQWLKDDEETIALINELSRTLP